MFARIIHLKFFLVVAFLISFPKSFGLKAKKRKTKYQYKTKLFLPDEKQSCPDIADSRDSFNAIKFCTLKAPDPGESTTMSFWGWDQGRTISTFEGVVEAYSVYDNGVENGLFEFVINSKGNYVQWYKREFTLYEPNITHIKLYYHIVEGAGRELNLRDVWVRPTAIDSGERPQRKCSATYHSIGVGMSVLSGIALLIFSYVEDGTSLISLSPKFWRIGRCFSPFVLVSSAMLTSYLDGYPYLRCKDDEFLVGVISIFLSGIIATFIYGVYLHYHPPIIRSNRVAPMPLSIENEITEEDVIREATAGSKRRRRISNEIVEDRKLYMDTDDCNECTVCMESYEANRPGIVLACGHVFCSKCLVQMHLVCASCRNEVVLKKLTLLVETPVNPLLPDQVEVELGALRTTRYTDSDVETACGLSSDASGGGDTQPNRANCSH